MNTELTKEDERYLAAWPKVGGALGYLRSAIDDMNAALEAATDGLSLVDAELAKPASERSGGEGVTEAVWQASRSFWVDEIARIKGNLESQQACFERIEAYRASLA